MIGKMVSNMMIRPGKAPVFGSPRDFELPFEAVDFVTSDGVTLRGWLVGDASDKVIIQSHFGVQCSRSGYSPGAQGWIKMRRGDIAFLRQAKHLVEQGYAVLMFDVRNHGESEGGSCPWISWGPNEAPDIVAAVDFVTKHPKLSGASIGLLSICMGAAATTYAFGLADEGLRARSQIKALIAVQPLHYKEFVSAFGIPAFVNKWSLGVSEERLGFNLNERSFLDDVPSIDVPTLVVQNRNDPWTKLDFVQAYYDGLTVEKELKWLELSKKRCAGYDYLGTSPDFLSDFFNKYV